MNTEFFTALDIFVKEKGIPQEYIIEKIEAGLANALKREIGENCNIKVILDPAKKDVKVVRVKNIVEEVTDPELEISLADAKAISKKYALGGTVETEVKTKAFGRLSAQSGKQIIVQGIREAERTMVIKEYESKKEEVISATVLRIDPVNGFSKNSGGEDAGGSSQGRADTRRTVFRRRPYQGFRYGGQKRG